jgi:hypothetical protein
MKGKPTYTPDHYVDVLDVWESSRLAYLLIDNSIFFTAEPMPDGVFRFYVKEEAIDLVKRIMNHEQVQVYTPTFLSQS